MWLLQPERISGDPYTVKSDVWSLGITLVELAIGRFPFSSDDGLQSDDEDGGDDDCHTGSRVSLPLALGGDEDQHLELEDSTLCDTGDDTLSPVRPAQKDQSLQQAERKRVAKQDAAQPASSNTKAVPGVRRKGVAGVSLAGSGHQMSILELLQYIVNEPAPRLPMGRFSPQVEEFINGTLRKEPVGWDTKRKGPLPGDVARPTPKELLVRSSFINPPRDLTDLCLCH